MDGKERWPAMDDTCDSFLQKCGDVLQAEVDPFDNTTVAFLLMRSNACVLAYGILML
jgi:hypothetical protein